MKKDLDEICMSLIKYNKDIPYISFRNDGKYSLELYFFKGLTENQLNLFKKILTNINSNTLKVDMSFQCLDINDFLNLENIFIIEELISEKKKTNMKFITSINISKIRRNSSIEVNSKFYNIINKYFDLNKRKPSLA